MVVTYREKAALLRAMKQFVQGRADGPFRKKATKVQVRYFKGVVDLFLSHRREIHHPHPRIAVSLALMMVVGTLHELVVWPKEKKHWKGLLPKDDQALKQELTRVFLSCLGVEANPAGHAGSVE
jgi:hypothetical protein